MVYAANLFSVQFSIYFTPIHGFYGLVSLSFIRATVPASLPRSKLFIVVACEMVFFDTAEHIGFLPLFSGV